MLVPRSVYQGQNTIVRYAVTQICFPWPEYNSGVHWYNDLLTGSNIQALCGMLVPRRVYQGQYHYQPRWYPDLFTLPEPQYHCWVCWYLDVFTRARILLWGMLLFRCVYQSYNTIVGYAGTQMFLPGPEYFCRVFWYPDVYQSQNTTVGYAGTQMFSPWPEYYCGVC